MGTPLGPKYIPYTYIDPLGCLLVLQDPKPGLRNFERERVHPKR